MTRAQHQALSEPGTTARRRGASSARIHLRPITLREANAHIDRFHSHHPRARGCKFCIGALDARGELHGVVVVERPKARMLDDGYTLELSRVCTDRTSHVASMLIAAATRAAFAMGAKRVISYVLENEAGTSYRAAGWRRVENERGVPIRCGGGEWSRPSRLREAMESPTCKKNRWEKVRVL
jgi:hypothetical protein